MQERRTITCIDDTVRRDSSCVNGRDQCASGSSGNPDYMVRCCLDRLECPNVGDTLLAPPPSSTTNAVFFLAVPSGIQSTSQAGGRSFSVGTPDFMRRFRRKRVPKWSAAFGRTDQRAFFPFRASISSILSELGHPGTECRPVAF